MSDTNEGKSAKLTKKQARKIVYSKFASALAEYQAGMKKKKFDSNLRKASKLFAADIAKAVVRQKIQKTKIKAVKNNLKEQNTSAGAAI